MSLVAQKLIAGEVDRGKVAREVGVSSKTIYNVAIDLRQHGYVLIDVNSPKSPPPPRVTSTPRTTQQSTQGEVLGRSAGEATSPSNSSGEVESREKYFPGETTQRDVPLLGRTQRPSQGTYRGPTREPGLTKEEVAEIVGEAMKQVVEAISLEVKPVEEVVIVTSSTSPRRAH